MARFIIIYNQLHVLIYIIYSHTIAICIAHIYHLIFCIIDNKSNIILI